jgi:TusA-related sulfurtransferase
MDKEMQIKRKLKLKGLLDPFTLLKFSQAYREIQSGDQLEILYEGAGLPEELFKVMPAGGFEVITEQALENEILFRIVLEKKAAPVAETPTGGCECS